VGSGSDVWQGLARAVAWVAKVTSYLSIVRGWRRSSWDCQTRRLGTKSMNVPMRHVVAVSRVKKRRAEDDRAGSLGILGG
jgi:hypothetical protein